MELSGEAHIRLSEVRTFLLFQCKVLRNQKKRYVSGPEQSPCFLVGSGMSYELQKMDEFLSQSDILKDYYAEIILFIRELRGELESEEPQRNPEKASMFFNQIEALMDKIGQKKI